MSTETGRKIVSGPAPALRGVASVPGDKSITHRAYLLAALAEGESTVHDPLEAEDCQSTRSCLAALGVEFVIQERCVLVRGGRSRWRAPSSRLDAGNSGTTARLLTGLLAGSNFVCELDGDASLRRRPFHRVIEPLAKMGAAIAALQAPGRLPIRVQGRPLKGMVHSLKVASAQVKSCLLLAGLAASGVTAVIEPAPSRDHTERMLGLFQVPVRSSGGRCEVEGGATLCPAVVHVPGDPSSAVFPLAAALLVPDSDVRVANVNGNSTRLGAFRVLRSMGADLHIESQGVRDGEPLASLRARTSSLTATAIGGDIIPSLIDELPILAVVATQARGTTHVRDAAELRVKETDRIAALVTELKRMGARIEERQDGFCVTGPTKLEGAIVDAHGDHRLAMSLAIAGLMASGTTIIEGADCVAISYPTFFATLASLGARLTNRPA